MKLSDVFHHRDHQDDKASGEAEAAGVPPHSAAHTAAGVLSGMAAGAVAGSMAGPPGIIAGAVIGSALGAAATMALDAQDAEDQQKDEALDRDIGVIGGHLGEAGPHEPTSVEASFFEGDSAEASAEAPQGAPEEPEREKGEAASASGDSE